MAATQGISIYGVSTDTQNDAQSTVDKLHLSFPILYGVDGPATATTLGCWYEQKRNIVQPAAFIIDPDRNLLSLTYTSGPIGRLEAKEALALIGFYSKKSITVRTVDRDLGWTENVTG